MARILPERLGQTGDVAGLAQHGKEGNHVR